MLLGTVAVLSCGETMDVGPLEFTLLLFVEVGPDESHGEEKPERKPPSLHMELPGVLSILMSLVCREKWEELCWWPSH